MPHKSVIRPTSPYKANGGGNGGPYNGIWGFITGRMPYVRPGPYMQGNMDFKKNL